MNISTAAVKSTAKTALKGGYLKNFAASAIYVFAFLVCLSCYGVLSSVLGIFAAFIFLIVALIFLIIPLTLGFIYFTVRLIFTKATEPVLMFKYFSNSKDYIRSLRFAFPLLGNAIFSGFLLFLPAFAVDLIANGTVFKLFSAEIPLWVSSLWSISAVLKVLAGLCLIVVMLKYYLAPFLLVADENMDPLPAMHMSKIISSVTKRDFIWLVLSVFPLISACIFLIPDIFVFPYFATLYCVHCRFAVASYNKSVDNISQKSIPSFEVI
ncbi:MAG: hypothetical protein J5659_06575 [Clostridia bacterium]|nr:hypothetical protein [Clostridia bacterium]